MRAEGGGAAGERAPLLSWFWGGLGEAGRVSALSLQRVPFTVSRARDAILFVAEWRFLARDEGDPGPEGDPDPERDGIWSKDEEPQTCPLDRMTPSIVPAEYEGSLSSEEVRRSPTPPDPARAVALAVSPTPTPDPLCPPARARPRISLRQPNLKDRSCLPEGTPMLSPSRLSLCPQNMSHPRISP